MQLRLDRVIFEVSGGLIALALGSAGASALEPAPETPAFVLAQADRGVHQSRADRYFEMGLQQFQGSQIRDAVESWEAALALYRELGDRQGEAKTLGNMGSAFYSLKRY